MSDIPFILTTAGAAALVNAANNGTDPIIISHCGVSPTAFAASAATTVLTGELKRISTLSGDVVEADTIHVVVRDESPDIYSLRSLGLYTDGGVLFAVYSQAAVIMEKSAGAMLLLAIDARFAGVDAALISFGDTNFLNPPATEEQQGVIEIATQAEANAGADDQRALTAKKAKAAILGWLLAQDGAGSGLDADLLDGLNSDYFTNIPARLGFTPLNALLYTAADVIAKLLTVDGAGSGVDADLLDGQQGSYYANIPARLGFAPVQQGTGVGQNSYNLIKIGWSGTRLKATIDASDIGNLVFDNHISDVWRASNDGSGSGMDADLLDGKHASHFEDIIGRLGYTPMATGYVGTIDMNAMLTDGVYRFNFATNGPPDVQYSQLLVLRGHFDTISQICTNYATGDLWVRSGNPPIVGGPAGGYWRPWRCMVGSTGTSNYSAADVLAKIVTVDGSGSGLDADLLDGKHASDFALLSGFESGSNANGYWRKLPDGTIEQWGTFTGAYPEGAAARTFPIPFTDLNSINVQSVCLNTGASAANDMWTQAGTQSLTGFSVVFQATSSGNTAFGARWRAIGR